MPLLLEKVGLALKRFSVAPKDKILVAVSGGPDSVCLLHCLRNLPEPYALSLHVAHLNHLFRPEAAREAHFVEKLVQDWDLPVTIEERPVLEICKEKGLSKQEGARKVRYQFLYEVAKKIDARWLALGHHADDQAETFLMRMLRGAGADGLRGIPEKRDDFILRPLIDCHRDEIMAVLSSDNISFVEDPSNKQPKYLRNKIRHQLLPELEEYNPNIKETLCREAALFASENELMHQVMMGKIPQLQVESSTNLFAFDIPSFLSLHIALQRRFLRWGIEKLCDGRKGISFQHIEMLRVGVILGKNGNCCHLPQGIIAKKQYSKFVIEKQNLGDFKNTREFQIRECQLPEPRHFPSNTVVDFPEWKLRLHISLSLTPSETVSPCKASFDFDKIHFPLSIRGWQPGDFFSPFGMEGQHKKLQDFFVDEKIPKEDRNRIPLLNSAKGILWLLGIRVDAQFRTTERTVRTLTIEMESLEEI